MGVLKITKWNYSVKDIAKNPNVTLHTSKATPILTDDGVGFDRFNLSYFLKVVLKSG